MPLQHAFSPGSLNDEERRAFHFFQSRTAPRIFGHHDANKWLSILLQLGHSEVPIKHALTALASLHESLEPVDVCGSIRQSVKHAQITAQILALKHYNAAIKSVRTESPNMSSRPDIIMTMCLLFICFEQFRSGDAACLVHLTAGLNLLYWWRRRTNAYGKLKEYSRPTLDLINDQITPTLQRLRVQFSLCMDSRHVLTGLDVPLCLPYPSSPSSYPTLDAARRDYDRAMNYVFSYLERDQSKDDQSLQKAPLAVLRQWKEAFDFSNFSTEPPTLQDCTRKLLELYYKTSTVIIETYGAELESVFDNYTSYFQAIVDLAECVTEAWMKDSKKFNLLFSFDLGITPPMFFVASRCRHPLIRRKAVNLMLHSPFYHGAWQDRYSGLCAQRIIEIEENATGIIVDYIDVPENRRIRKISADLQEEESQISMRFTRPPFTPASPVYTTFISFIT
jgi:antitoxin component HigA of HigAB toxin-antitoxin module